jgi:maltokinase
VTLPSAPLPEGLEALVGPYLERQDWYHDALSDLGSPGALAIETTEVIAGSWAGGTIPGLARLVIAVDGARFQIVVGWRDPESVGEAVSGSDYAVLGSLPAPAGDVLVYDALADEELMLALLGVASGGQASASRARIVESLTSHASIVYDERLFMKLYRVLVSAPRREVELMMRLDEARFNHIVAPVAVWTSGGFDLAIVREFVSGALEGRALAVTSLRDLLGRATDAAMGAAVPGAAGASTYAGGDSADVDDMVRYAGGDLAAEVRRLGAMTARLHLALSSAFGESEADTDALGESIAVADPATGAQIRAMHDVGKAIRIHGDYQLRRVMRTDAGWIVAGFGDDPSPGARLDPSQPVSSQGVALEDVADMCHALREVADSVLGEHGRGDPPSAIVSPRSLTDAWVRRNSAAFVDGYLTVPAIRELLPRHPAAFHLLLEGLEKLRAHRSSAA